MSIKFTDNKTIEIAFVSGVYAIINRKNNRFYIGESVNIKKRKSVHLHSLKNNKHHNIELQNDFNLYGEEAFEFKLLLPHMNQFSLIHTKAELIVLENEFINHYKDKFNLYNKEKTLDDIINSTNFYDDALYKHSKALKIFVVKTLLNNEIIWIENIPTLIPLQTIDNTFDAIKRKRKMRQLLEKAPEQIKDSASVRSITYINAKKEEATIFTILIHDLKIFSKWLYDNRFIKEEVYNEINDINNASDEKNEQIEPPAYQIAQSKLFNKLKETGVIKEELTYHECKDMLVKLNIYKIEDDIYVPTQYAIDMGYIANHIDKKIWFTESGEKTITELIKNHILDNLEI